jgi:hypothetical protein
MLDGVGFDLASRSVRDHVIRREPGGIVRVTLGSEITEADIQPLVDVVVPDQAERGSLALILDFTRMGTMSPSVRKAGAHVDLSAYGSVAIVGASYRMSVLIKLIQRAFALLSSRPVQPTGYFATEAEARAWIAAQQRASRTPR